jgi:hypothetical protein
MPWQRQVADTALEFDPVTGHWCYPTVVLTVQRQAGKSTLVGPMAAHRCLTGVDRKCWYTAQTRIDARDTFMDLVKLLRRSPLATRIKVRESNGSESITFPTGSDYRLFAPTDEALHGKANHLVTVDEAWVMSEARGDQLTQSIVPTFATTGGQLWVLSTMGTADSTWFHGLCDAGRLMVDAGRTDAVAYFEWSIGDDVDPGDLAAVAAAHPANPYRIDDRALAAAYARMKPGEFARAFGNRRTTAAERVIPSALWLAGAAAHTVHPGLDHDVALAFDVGYGETDAAILAAWRDDDGAHVEVVDARPGVSWLVPRVVELAGRWSPRAVGHDNAGPAVLAADALTRAGVDLTPTNTRQYAVACAGLLAELVAGRLHYTPHPALDAAAAAATKRVLGDGAWGWGRKSSAGSIAAIVAASVALYTFEHAAPPAPFTVG